jgi:uncharacterized protein YbjT (DUF2867 family)
VAIVVVFAGGGSRTGQLVSELTERRGHAVRRVPAPVTGPADLVQLHGVDAIVLIPTGARGAGATTRWLRDEALRLAPGAHVLLVSSFAVGHGPRHPLGRVTGALPDLVEAERTLRAGPAPYTIVRPTWLTDDPAGAHAITLTQDARADGMLARADLAATLVAAVEQPFARDRTFALFNEPGEPPREWGALFTALSPDTQARPE